MKPVIIYDAIKKARLSIESKIDNAKSSIESKIDKLPGVVNEIKSGVTDFKSSFNSWKSDWTSSRAAKLDKLDKLDNIDIKSSTLATASGLAKVKEDFDTWKSGWTPVRANKIDKLDMLEKVMLKDTGVRVFKDATMTYQGDISERKLLSIDNMIGKFVWLSIESNGSESRSSSGYLYTIKFNVDGRLFEIKNIRIYRKGLRIFSSDFQTGATKSTAYFKPMFEQDITFGSASIGVGYYDGEYVVKRNGQKTTQLDGEYKYLNAIFIAGLSFVKHFSIEITTTGHDGESDTMQARAVYEVKV